MSRSLMQYAGPALARGRATLPIAMTALIGSTLPAQTALGTPYIGSNTLSFYSTELPRSGAPETATTYGVAYGHRFGMAESATRMTMLVRLNARAIDEEKGLAEFAARVGVSHDVRQVPGLALAAAWGVGAIAWGDNAADTGRVHFTIPAEVGASYDLRIGSATVSPFASASMQRYNRRTGIESPEVVEKGWDATYTTGVSLRLSEIVLTSSRIAGEWGMPQRSRWAFSAGVSF
jgi:hypothetical protein